MYILISCCLMPCFQIPDCMLARLSRAHSCTSTRRSVILDAAPARAPGMRPSAQAPTPIQNTWQMFILFVTFRFPVPRLGSRSCSHVRNCLKGCWELGRKFVLLSVVSLLRRFLDSGLLARKKRPPQVRHRSTRRLPLLATCTRCPCYQQLRGSHCDMSICAPLCCGTRFFWKYACRHFTFPSLFHVFCSQPQLQRRKMPSL